jgi:hypothetical protein
MNGFPEQPILEEEIKHEVSLKLTDLLGGVRVEAPLW